jgi:type IV secretion system protein VirB10
MQKSNDNKVTGQPVIAEQVRHNKIAIIAVVAVLVVMLVVYVLLMTSHKEVTHVVEDSYSVNTGSTSSLKVTQAGSLPAGHDSSQVSQQPNKEEVEVKLQVLQEKQQELKQRLTAPLMLVNNAGEEKDKPATQSERDKDGNPNTQFLQNVAGKEVQSSAATVMGSLNTVIAQGTLIHATLESATNSDLPGALRAIVAEPTYSEDGSRVLIPRGSRLIGEYKSGMVQWQSRIFVVWSRLITPDGVSVNLGSGGVDSLGVSGMAADYRDRHFWERFGTATLLSLIGAGASTVGVTSNDQDNSASAYRSAVANSFAQSANQSVQQTGAIPPTLMTIQGKPIMVFVAKDLQFAMALKETQSSINVF